MMNGILMEKDGLQVTRSSWSASSSPTPLLSSSLSSSASLSLPLSNHVFLDRELLKLKSDQLTATLQKLWLADCHTKFYCRKMSTTLFLPCLLQRKKNYLRVGVSRKVKLHARKNIYQRKCPLLSLLLYWYWYIISANKSTTMICI